MQFVITYQFIAGEFHPLSGDLNRFASRADAERRLAHLRRAFPYSANRFSITEIV